MISNQAVLLVTRFIEAFDAADINAIQDYLAEDLVADVTQPDGSVATLVGRSSYVGAIEAMDLPAVRPSIKATQIAPVADDQVLVMVEIKAICKDHTLHNFAAFLMRVVEGSITRIWMVEALPAESDRFWKR
ncbi:MAG: nuclear transport factor 2 family protein [Pseudomonadota bacterium]